MSDSLVAYNATFQNGDTNSTSNAYVKRANDKSINVGVANVAGLVNSAQTVLTPLSLTTTATLSGLQSLVFAASAGGAYTVTLPPVAASAGISLTVIKTDSAANTVTLKGNGSELINGSNTYTGLTTQYYVIKLYCDGTAWYAGKLA